MRFQSPASVELRQQAPCAMSVLFLAILSWSHSSAAAAQQDDPRPFLIGDIKSCCFFDEKTLLTASSKGELCQWDVGSAKLSKRFQVVDDPLYDLSVISGGKKMIAAAGAGDNDKIIQIDLISGKAVGSLKLSSGIERLLPTPDGKLVIAACEDASVRVYDLESGKEVMRLEAAFKGKWTPSEPAPELKDFPPELQKELNKPLFSPTCLDASVSSDGKTLAVTYQRIIMTGDKNVHVWDLATGKHINEFRVKGLSGGWLSFNPKKPGVLMLNGPDDRAVAVWNPSKEEAPTVMLISHRGSVKSLTPRMVRWWRQLARTAPSSLLEGEDKPKLLDVLPYRTLPIYEMAFSPDGKLLAVRAYNVTKKINELFIWELSSGKLMTPR